MKNARLIIDRNFVIAPVDPRIFGSFTEHLGRCIYEGLYQPGHVSADSNGFRQDVLDLVRDFGVTVVRYPGGNFVSGYNWEDGIGPKAGRPVRADLAWHVLETNQFGTDEFISWCRQASCEPMLALNLGTRGVPEALQLLEYCNFSAGTRLSDLRVANGSSSPHAVKLWCLGNEMDGLWQLGHKTAYEYGRLAAEVSRAMKELDPTIETVACGSSNSQMPLYGSWESEVLAQCYDEVDYLSLHHYFNNKAGDTPEFLAGSVAMDRFIQEVIAICDAEKAKKRSSKKINLSFDEWNVWYHSNQQDRLIPLWSKAPHQLEDVYNFEDALLVGSLLITLLNHADRVKIACMAQLVNVIAPIMTSDSGAWRQTIFYPFALTSKYGRGVVLQSLVDVPTYESIQFGEVPLVQIVSLSDEDSETFTLFAVNKDLQEDVLLSCDLRQFMEYRLLEQVELCHDDLKAVNSETNPGTVTPRTVQGASLLDGHLKAPLSRQSWNMIRLSRG